jgi:hypothetical protein
LTEIADSHNVELGESHIESALIRYASRPLDEIAEEIFKTTRAFGKVQDDQTPVTAALEGEFGRQNV